MSELAIDMDDLTLVILDWECHVDRARCCADVDFDGDVDVDDMTAVLVAWGPCPEASGSGGMVELPECAEPIVEALESGNISAGTAQALLQDCLLGEGS